MIRTTRFSLRASAIALGLAVTSLISVAAQAASINYGDFGPVAGTSFKQVTESSVTDPVPLYGPPSLFPVGMDFDPTNFGAASMNSIAGGVDQTDGQLNFSIANPAGVLGISLLEAGDYSLSGTGTAATTAQAGAILRATITEVNGVVVAPIVLPPVNASVSFNLVANAGVAQPWALGFGLNINLPQGQRATLVEVVIDNTLIATSEPLSQSLIVKKEFIIRTEVPEPATMALAGLGICGLVLVARRKRSLSAV